MDIITGDRKCGFALLFLGSCCSFFVVQYFVDFDLYSTTDDVCCEDWFCFVVFPSLFLLILLPGLFFVTFVD